MKRLLASIAENFTPGDRVSGDLIDGDLSPEDIVGHKLVEILAADEKLEVIFGGSEPPEGRIEYLPLRPLFDFRPGPRLQVYAASTPEDEAPTRIAIGRIGMVVAIRADALEWQPIAQWAPALSTLVHHIRKVQRTTKSLQESINGDASIPLAMEWLPQPVNHLIEVEEGGRRAAFVLEMPSVYRLDVDTTTGRIANILKAGG